PGARFDPVLNSWNTVAPFYYASRQQHTAVWTGSEMIIWGGLDTYSTAEYPYPNYGGRYNPSKDTWQVTPYDPNAPIPVRGNHVAVWTGSDMLIWGGYDGTSYFNTTYRYTPPQTMYLYLKP
ncbi:MAG: hypothetical protein JWM68_1386, partial [Verrucomicrobiales bacterium]|nr:hypothetical protein [Verrucomicrobiales bacterium]